MTKPFALARCINICYVFHCILRILKGPYPCDPTTRTILNSSIVIGFWTQLWRCIPISPKLLTLHFMLVKCKLIVYCSLWVILSMIYSPLKFVSNQGNYFLFNLIFSSARVYPYFNLDLAAHPLLTFMTIGLYFQLWKQR